MMDGPAHYVEAEKSFQKAKEAARLLDGASAVLYMQAAQWHATMALAATAMKPPSRNQGNCTAETESHTALGEIAGFETGAEF